MLENSGHWLNRAKEARAMAELLDGTAKAEMLKIAISYEKIALNADRRGQNHDHGAISSQRDATRD
jgi:hypothetical protein